MPSKYKNEEIKYSFNSKDAKCILIGRDKKSDIKLDWDKSYSKIQSTLFFDDFSNRWKFMDGSSKGLSRNGSWLYVSKSFEISDGLILKVGNGKLLMNLKSK